MILRDKFWLWGHPEGRYNKNAGEYGCPDVSRMTPMEACLYLGIRNTFMVPVGVKVNRRQYNKSFKTLNKVGWECFVACQKPERIDEIIEEAKEFPNISCVVLDDFKVLNHGIPRYKEFPLSTLEDINRKLHNNSVRRLDSWMVLYTYQFGVNEEEDKEFQPYMDEFDGVIMWTWKESDVPLIPEKFRIFKKQTPNTRRMVGCYLYNFGEAKQATGDAVKWQLDYYRDLLLKGEIEGVVLHTNTMADLDYEAYDVACKWMDEHGDETIG
ncbi:MAG: hypothetical protein E7646_07610 [Ruminococcaceae bacterium]|nr:hypothetical protein [Oscillospiraceae bacterium]